MHTATKRRSGFKSSAIHKRKEPHALHYLSERTSFWVASLSLFAFVTGNMIGQHGWHVFWKSVMGKYDDSLIVYEGTVAPVKKIPDYRKWSLYGGDSQEYRAAWETLRPQIAAHSAAYWEDVIKDPKKLANLVHTRSARYRAIS